MHNKLWSFASVLVILAFLLTTGVTPARAGENVTLLGISFMPGRGLVLMFGLPDGYDASEFDAHIIVDGISYPLDCAPNLIGQLVCQADVSKQHIGSSATVSVDGLIFEVVLREQVTWCYAVYDYGPGAIPWGQIGTYCQRHEGVDGEQIEFYNPNWDENFDYTFGRPYCPGVGTGYAYEGCQEFTT